MKLLYALALLAALGLVLSPVGLAGDKNKGDQKEQKKGKGDKKDKGKKDTSDDLGDNKNTDNLDGVWMLIAMEEAGKKGLFDKGTKMVIKGNTFTLEAGGKSVKGTYKADASRTPKAVTAYFDDGQGNKIQIDSIYDLKDDTMRVCGALGKDRPKEFSSTAENGYELVTYKRAK